MSCRFDLFWIEHMESNHGCPMPYREAEGHQHQCQPPQCGRKQADARELLDAFFFLNSWVTRH
uniref:Uncharacterized protein n=1 Tax=Triticum urartu TaxID=4572 RepID=A0A8R7TH66_TRIUA